MTIDENGARSGEEGSFHRRVTRRLEQPPHELGADQRRIARFYEHAVAQAIAPVVGRERGVADEATRRLARNSRIDGVANGEIGLGLEAEHARS